MTDLQIVPIFNQAAPYVWRDFARIYSCAMYNRADYDEHLLNSQRQVCIHAQKLCQKQLSLAFGAYVGRRMVGFIRGDAGDSCGYVDALYVLPE